MHPALLFLLLGALAGICPRGQASQELLPAPAEVSRRLIERSQKVAATEGTPQYIFPKRTLIERLDSLGQVTGSEERLYEVTLIRGIPLNHLLKITGREMSPDELQAEQEREERFQRRLSSMDPKELAARRGALVTAELLNHYQFSVSRRIQLNGRPTLVVTFKPADNSDPPKSLRDRVLNRIGGTLWVDEQDWELARVSARLIEPISMGWFGWLGSLSQCELGVDRQRMPDGVWVNTLQAWALQFRRLTATTRLRVAETSSGFRRSEPN